MQFFSSTKRLQEFFFQNHPPPNDRHNGQLQVQLDQGEYAALPTEDQRNFAVAQSTIFLVAYHLIRLGYFLGLAKSILTPKKVVPSLGW